MKTVRKLILLLFGMSLCAMLSVTAFASDYTVVPGDCLWRIAKRELGSGPRWTEIYEANRQQIADPHWIYPGQIFALPDDGAGEKTEAVTVKQASETTQNTEEKAAVELTAEALAYADESAWISRPVAEKDTDILFLVGNSYLISTVTDPLICDSSSAEMRSAARDSFARSEMTAADANVFAPYYSQVGVITAERKTVSEASLQNGPKEDVFAALDYYLANLNGGRSFRLAGEGQGRQLVDMILKEYMPLHPEYAGLLMQA